MVCRFFDFIVVVFRGGVCGWKVIDILYIMEGISGFILNDTGSYWMVLSREVRSDF